MCVYACVRAYVRAYLHARARMCVCVCVSHLIFSDCFRRAVPEKALATVVKEIQHLFEKLCLRGAPRLAILVIKSVLGGTDRQKYTEG